MLLKLLAQRASFERSVSGGFLLRIDQSVDRRGRVAPLVVVLLFLCRSVFLSGFFHQHLQAVQVMQSSEEEKHACFTHPKLESN